MYRFVLALVLVLALVGLLASVIADIRKATMGPDETGGASLMQKVAYFVLIALMLYVSIMGASA